jgi:hypothetical protein
MGIKIGNIIQAKMATIARSDTANKFLFMLPPNAQIIRVSCTGTASDSATSASVVLAAQDAAGNSTTVATYDAKTANGGFGVLDAGANTRLGYPAKIYGSYGEVGAASTGGDWTVVAEYM